MPRKAISATTRARIKASLEVFVENLVRRYQRRKFERPVSFADYIRQKPSPKDGKLRPFQAAIMPPELRRISAFERGLSTGLGTSYEECARLIALEHHRDAKRSYSITGPVSLNALSEVEQQVALYERAGEVKDGSYKPDLDTMIGAVMSARHGDDLVERIARADLYILAQNGTEYFFEMKSPDANRGQCLEMTQRVLRTHLLRGKLRPDVLGYFAMAYNPDGPSREDYNWSIVKTYLPFDQMTVIGDEFWTIVGGPTAYMELLDIYAEVGRDKAKYILDALAFGF